MFIINYFKNIVVEFDLSNLFLPKFVRFYPNYDLTFSNLYYKPTLIN